MDTFQEIVLAAHGRRKHSAEFKARLVQACHEQGMSTAAIARANEVDANMLRRWVRDHAARQAASALAAPQAVGDASGVVKFVPIQVAAGNVSLPAIRIEWRRGASTASVHWPAEQAQACAVWLREWLR